MTNEPRLLAILALGVMMAVAFAGCGEDGGDEDLISSTEALEIADPIALNWDNNSVIYAVSGWGIKDGLAEEWSISYVNPNEITKNASLELLFFNQSIYITVYSDGTTSMGFSDTYYDKIGWSSVGNGFIDGEEAYEIAESCSEIKNYISSHNGKIDTFRLNSIKFNDTWTTVWYIHWDKIYGDDESFARAEIYIDAYTGEILEVG